MTTLKASAPVAPPMQCHYCDRDADVAVEKGDLKVGVCTEHFREQMEAVAESDWIDDLDEEIDLDSGE